MSTDDAIPREPERPQAAPRPHRQRRGILAAGVLLAAGGAVFAFHDPQATKASAPAAPSAIPVTSVLAVTQDLPIVRSGLGTVTAINQVDVKARVDGQLQRIGFTEGQEVKAGDLLARIDPRPYQAQLDQAKANLQKDRAQLANALTEQARATKLNKAGAGTSQASDTADAQVAIDQATVVGDQAAVDTAQLNLTFATIVAPVSGRVGLKQIDEGAIVHASDAAGIVTITQIHPISVLFSLPQDNLPDLLAGQKIAPLKVSIDTRDGARRLADGWVTVIDSQVDATTGTIKLKAEFANDDRSLWPGELVTARVRVRTDRNAVVVPSIAVQNGQHGPYLFTIKPDGTVAVTPVKTGPTVNDLTALTSGASAGDDVVLSGQSRLKNGTKVDAKRSGGAAQTVASDGR